MRFFQAIVLLVTLVTAPLAVVANAASFTRYQDQLQLMAQQDDCAHIPLGICGCERGPAPALSLISPLGEFVLPQPVPLPSLKISSPELRAPDFVVRWGFSPVAFHPPRILLTFDR